MPELPEVETVRRTLQPAVGAKIVAVWDSGKPLHMQRKPPRKKLRGLIGARITKIRRHGKYLLVDTDTPDALLVHLGMTGRFLIVPGPRSESGSLHLRGEASPRSKHTHLVLWLDDGRELRFVDARRFGQLDVVARDQESTHPALSILGPDPLEHGIDGELLYTRSRGRKSPLKAFVLDQSVLAGVGNIYASEALWKAQLRPTKRAHTLTHDTARRLAEAILEVLHNALDNGGTSLRDFVDADGAEGENADYLWVYGRAGEECLRCKSTIRRAVHQGRATYYCPTCQTP
jgi:formamidopyrimidine-DNA glycosylase